MGFLDQGAAGGEKTAMFGHREADVLKYAQRGKQIVDLKRPREAEARPCGAAWLGACDDPLPFSKIRPEEGRGGRSARFTKVVLPALSVRA